MTEKEHFVLEVLSDGTWWLSTDLARKSNGLLKLSAVCMTLRRMERKGMVETFKTPPIYPNSARKRLYKISEHRA